MTDFFFGGGILEHGLHGLLQYLCDCPPILPVWKTWKKFSLRSYSGMWSVPTPKIRCALSVAVFPPRQRTTMGLLELPDCLKLKKSLQLISSGIRGKERILMIQFFVLRRTKQFFYLWEAGGSNYPSSEKLATYCNASCNIVPIDKLPRIYPMGVLCEAFFCAF